MRPELDTAKDPDGKPVHRITFENGWTISYRVFARQFEVIAWKGKDSPTEVLATGANGQELARFIRKVSGRSA